MEIRLLTRIAMLLLFWMAGSAHAKEVVPERRVTAPSQSTGCQINALKWLLNPSVEGSPLDSERLLQLSRTRRRAHDPEPTLIFSQFAAARNYVQEFPLFKRFGFDSGNYSLWTPVVARLPSSSFYGKAVGWERKLANGDFARYRFDYDPTRGAHYNVEMRVTNETGVRETFKFAVEVKCAGQVCSESQARANFQGPAVIH